MYIATATYGDSTTAGAPAYFVVLRELVIELFNQNVSCNQIIRIIIRTFHFGQDYCSIKLHMMCKNNQYKLI